MNNNKNFKLFIVTLAIISALAIIVLVTTRMLNLDGVINQGAFRINDAVLTSTIEVIEKENYSDNQEDKAQELSDIIFDVSQLNKFSLLIPKTLDISKIFINNIDVNYPSKQGEMYIYQEGFDKKYNLAIENLVVDISPNIKEEQYFFEININNEFFVKDVNAPSDTKLIKFDGTVLDLINIRISDISFKIKFDLNIIDSTGKLNVCKIKLSMPNDNLVTDGISVIRQNIEDYIFTVKR